MHSNVALVMCRRPDRQAAGPRTWRAGPCLARCTHILIHTFTGITFCGEICSYTGSRGCVKLKYCGVHSGWIAHND